jgi:hypothetical protein
MRILLVLLLLLGLAGEAAAGEPTRLTQRVLHRDAGGLYGRVAIDRSGFVVVMSAGRTLIFDLRAGTRRELPTPAGCGSVHAGAGQLLWHCADEPRLADLRTGEPVAAPPGAAEIEQRSICCGAGRDETEYEVDGPVGRRWLGFGIYDRETAETSYIDRLSGRVSDGPAPRRGHILDLDQPDLDRRLCAPVRPPLTAAAGPQGSAPPYFAWASSADADRDRHIHAQRCGRRQIRRLGTCERIQACQGPFAQRGWVAWGTVGIARAVHLPTGRRVLARGPELLGLADRWLVTHSARTVSIARLPR